MAATGSSRSNAVTILRETILRHMNRRVGKTAADLMVDVRDDYGSVGERRFYRQLTYLVEVGCARRDKDEMANWDRIESADNGFCTLVFMYYLVDQRLPKPCSSHCDICGAIGTRTSSHPLHLRLRRSLDGNPFSYVPLRSAARQPSASSPGSRPRVATPAPQPHRP